MFGPTSAARGGKLEGRYMHNAARLFLVSLSSLIARKMSIVQASQSVGDADYNTPGKSQARY